MKDRAVRTVIRLVMRDEEFTLNGLAVTLLNQGVAAATINRNLSLATGEQMVFPYAYGTVNQTDLKVEFEGVGTSKLLVLTTELI